MRPYDVKKELKACYAPKNLDWKLIEVPPRMRYLSIEGAGDPNTASAYTEAVQALYVTIYTLKFSLRERPFIVGPLEGLWWADDMSTFVTRQKDAWFWKMLISLPPWMADSDVEAAKRAAVAKKQLAAIERVSVTCLSEGLCAQLLHIGAYDDEGPKLARLHDEMLGRLRLELDGTHHEIYLSDPRRTAAAKLKTILRQPVKRRSA